MKKLSIIIPCFNSQKTIERCIKSIKTKNNRQVEILVIDDGSTDNSAKIVQEMQKYSLISIKLIKTENNGPSEARNIGVKESNGEYISFVDSDDFVDENYVDTLIENIEKFKCDMIFFNYRAVTENNQVIYTTECNLEKNVNFSKYVSQLIKNDIFGYSITKCVKRDIIIENNIKMKNNIKICEDLLFTCDLVEKAKDIVCINDIIYSYVIYNNSLSRNIRYNLLNEYEYVNRLYFSFLEKNSIDDYENIICKKGVQTIVEFIKIIKQFNKETTFKWIFSTFTYTETIKYFDFYKKSIKGKKTIPLYIALKYKSTVLLKLISYFV